MKENGRACFKQPHHCRETDERKRRGGKNGKGTNKQAQHTPIAVFFLAGPAALLPSHPAHPISSLVCLSVRPSILSRHSAEPYLLSPSQYSSPSQIEEVKNKRAARLPLFSVYRHFNRQSSTACFHSAHTLPPHQALLTLRPSGLPAHTVQLLPTITHLRLPYQNPKLSAPLHSRVLQANPAQGT